MDANRQKKIQALANRLLDTWEPQREDVFQQLAGLVQDDEVDCVLDCLLSAADLPAVSWLVRYLNTVGTTHAIKKILVLLDNYNPNVRLQACEGVEGIPGDRQTFILTKMFELRNRDVVLFAVRQVGYLGRAAAADALARLLRRQSDEEIVAAILQVLGRLRDSRTLPVLERYTAHHSALVQEAALAAIAKFSVKVNSRFLRKCLASADPRFRGMAYSVILRLKSSRWEKAFALAFAREPDEKLKMQVLAAIRSFQRRESLRVLLQNAGPASPPAIRMMAKSVLLRVRAKTICDLLFAELARNDPRQKELILRVLAVYAAEPPVAAKLIEYFATEENDRIRLIIVASLGFAPLGQARDFLLQLVRDNGRFAYPAATALAEKITRQDWPIIEEVLGLEEQRYSAPIQVFLNFLAGVPEGTVYPPAVVAAVKRLARSPIEMIRLLGIRCFARIDSPQCLPNLLVMLTNETQNISRQVVLKEVIRLVNQDPALLTAVINTCMGLRKLLPLITVIFSLAEVKDPGKLKHVTAHILGLIITNKDRDPATILLENERLLLLLHNLAMRERSGFFALLREASWDDEQRRILLQVVNATDLYRFEALDEDFMAGQYAQASAATKREFLKFFRKLKRVPPALEQAVFKDLTQSTDGELISELHGVFGAWSREPGWAANGNSPD